MLGELRWTFDGDVPSSSVAAQGDIVYAPPQTWHAPQFWGKEGLNCRLTSSTYPSVTSTTRRGAERDTEIARASKEPVKKTRLNAKIAKRAKKFLDKSFLRSLRPLRLA